MASLQLLAEALARDLVDAHELLTILLSHACLTVEFLDIVTHLIAGFLVLLAQVPLVQPLLVLNLHVDRVEHETFILDRDRKFLNLILAVYEGCGISVLEELLLFLFVVEGATDWIEVVSFPVLGGRLGFRNLLVGEHLLVVMLEVLVADNIVVLEPLVRHLLHNWL